MFVFMRDCVCGEWKCSISVFIASDTYTDTVLMITFRMDRGWRVAVLILSPGD